MPSFFQDTSQIDTCSCNFTAIGQNKYNIHHADFAYNREQESILASLKPVADSYVQPCMYIFANKGVAMIRGMRMLRACFNELGNICAHVATRITK